MILQVYKLIQINKCILMRTHTFNWLFCEVIYVDVCGLWNHVKEIIGPA